MVGGMVTSTVLTLLVIPVIYGIWAAARAQAYDREAVAP